MENLINYFLPSKSLSQRLDIFELRKRKLFIQFCLVSLVGILVFTTSHFIGGKYYSALVNVTGATMFFGSLLFYKYSGYYTLSTSLYLVGAMFVIGAQHYLAPSHMQSNLMWFPLISLISYFLVPRRSAIALMFVCAGFALVSHIGSSFFPIAGDTFNNADKHTVNILTIILSVFIGHLVGSIILGEEGQTLDQVENKNKELAELSESNTALLSILSHDLANHIQIAYGFGNKTKDLKIEDEEVSRCLYKMNGALENMKRIVDEVRGYTATKSGKIEIQLSPVNLNQAVKDSIQIFKKNAIEKSITINMNSDLDDSSKIVAEPVALVNSVLNNLISNAIKFSNTNSHIDILITDLGPKVAFVVRDYGVGMPDDILSHIFNPSETTSREGTEGERGTGLGMPILKMFIDKFGADIDVTSSTRGVTGTEFRIHFKKQQDVA